MVKSGIINENGIIALENNNLIPYLYNLLNESLENKSAFKTYKQNQLFCSDSNIRLFCKSFRLHNYT